MMTFDPGFGDFWRLDGPGHLRLIMQPLGAILLGVRDGRLDAKLGLLPFHSLLLGSGRRHRVLGQGLSTILIPLLLAVASDAVVQYLVLAVVHPIAALIVGILLVGAPYAAVRMLANALLRRWRPSRPAGGRVAETEAHHHA
jgi:hypothetical protein